MYEAVKELAKEQDKVNFATPPTEEEKYIATQARIAQYDVEIAALNRKLIVLNSLRQERVQEAANQLIELRGETARSLTDVLSWPQPIQPIKPWPYK